MHDPAWSLTPAALARVLNEVSAGREPIVECGSGASTVEIARRLRALGRGRLYSLEHDPAWAARTRARLEREGLNGAAQLVEAPLCAQPFAGPAGWYDPAALERLPAQIELLLVDGPPADLAPDGETRYPALPVLAHRLAAGAVVMLDDIQRPGERAILERWRRKLPVQFDVHQRDRVAIGVFSPAQDPANAGMALERGT